jgi:hypothetical protein
MALRRPSPHRMGWPSGRTRSGSYDCIIASHRIHQQPHHHLLARLQQQQMDLMMLLTATGVLSMYPPLPLPIRLPLSAALLPFPRCRCGARVAPKQPSFGLLPRPQYGGVRTRGVWMQQESCRSVMHGARFPTEIYTRGCHWIPRMFA